VTEYITVPRERVGLELDEYLALLLPEMNKGFLRREVAAGRIRLDGMETRPSKRLREGQVVVLEIDLNQAPTSVMGGEVSALDVLWEDDDVLAIDKPAGLATEPERWDKDSGSVAGSLAWLATERGGAFRPRIVHRLDKDTSGVLIAAKDLEAERRLRRSFEEAGVKKEYLALVEGEHPLGDAEEETIDLPLGPEMTRSGHPHSSGRQVVDDAGRPSQTRVVVETRFRGYTLMRCRPLTGRTHQIRVHLAATGFPLMIDPFYGRRDKVLLSELKTGYKRKPGRPERPLMARLTLHAARIEFPRADGSPATVESPLPADLARLLKQLAKVRSLQR
jgi:23S rRNA pseudouridine1911/1915/1917 synthase